MENITIQDILDATGGTLLCGDPSMKIRPFKYKFYGGRSKHFICTDHR